MSDIVIKVENLGKRYSIRHETGGRYTTLRDVLGAKARGTFKNLHSRKADKLKEANGSNDSNVSASQHFSVSDAPACEDFWALRHVSFQVRQGEVVGIIGRNGAGKSTLLKVLSRITEPTEGRARLRGRVASLLEVGTGFHPELTARENIYLNGAILGMNRAEIRARFDEIVAFAEIEKFLDTPVKRYSSGMYVRLAFAVAAHLEPEILIIDEVLAVGDAEFRKKCLGKMDRVAKGGRTILFVSHDMAAVNRLCSECILLVNGEVATHGSTERVVETYLSQGLAERSIELPRNPEDERKEFKFVSLRMVGSSGDISSTLSTADALTVEIDYIIEKPIRNLRVTLKVQSADGFTLFESSDLPAFELKSRPPGHYISSARIPPYLLNVGTYFVSVGADVPMDRVVAEPKTMRFAIEELAINQMVYSLHGKPLGVIHPPVKWSVSQQGAPTTENVSYLE